MNEIIGQIQTRDLRSAIHKSFTELADSDIKNLTILKHLNRHLVTFKSIRLDKISYLEIEQ